MSHRISIGKAGSGKGRNLVFGIALLAFGLLMAWVAREDGNRELYWVAGGLTAAALWLLLGGLVFKGVDTLRVLGGVVCLVLGLGCLGLAVWIVVQALPGKLVLAPLGALIPIGLLWLVGAELTRPGGAPTRRRSLP